MKGSVIIVDNFFFHGDVLNKTKSTKVGRQPWKLFAEVKQIYKKYFTNL